MKSMIAAFVLLLTSDFVAAAFATPQIGDRLKYGGHVYAIVQAPMTGLWHYEIGEPPTGKVPAPKFDFAGTSNWRSYCARWEIRDSKLWLRSIRARMDGKNVRDEEILRGETFPVEATWFTGKIHLPVGDYIQDSGEFESVIIFEIERGKVRSTTYRAKARVEFGWNGLDY